MIWENLEVDPRNVTASVIQLNGETVLKVERDLEAIPFNADKLESSVDEPTFVRLRNCVFENGTIEVKVYSEIQDPTPFDASQGFIGVAYRISEGDSAFECIYLRPRIGRSDNQMHRNHTVQYFAYSDFKFETSRKLEPNTYETSAPVDIHEWITMRIEVNGERAELFINDFKYNFFIVTKMKSSSKKGSIGMYVDIGTIGYFKDLKVVKK
jgi:hypothetical protein